MRITGVLLFVVLSCAPARAALVPFWRVNPINAQAVAEAPVLANAISVSLMVELSGVSEFAFGGFDFRTLLPTARYYHRIGGGGMDSTAPLPKDISLSPALEFDTYWTAPNQVTEVTFPGRLNGTGAAQRGRDNFVPPTGPHRVGENMNVGWINEDVPGPNNDGTFEVARVTMVGVVPGSTVVPTTMGNVGDLFSPSIRIPLPPIPVMVPEPATCVVMALLPMFRRMRRATNVEALPAQKSADLFPLEN